VTRIRLTSFTAVLLAAGSAFAQHAEEAEHAGHHAPDWSLVGFHVLAVVILGAVLAKFAGPPLRDYMRDRSENLRRQLEAAKIALEKSKAANAQMQSRLTRIAEENESLVREAADLAERERSRAIERAKAAAERVREEAKRAADQEIERARAALQTEAAKLAVSLAGELVRNNLNPDDEKRLVGDFVSRVGQPS
jgi:F-type H+-transporting ATPase subunit b